MPTTTEWPGTDVTADQQWPGTDVTFDTSSGQTPPSDEYGTVTALGHGLVKGGTGVAAGMGLAASLEGPNAAISAATGPFAPVTMGGLNVLEFLGGMLLANKVVDKGEQALAPNSEFIRNVQKSVQEHPIAEQIGQTLPMTPFLMRSIKGYYDVAKSATTAADAAKAIAARGVGGATAGAVMEASRPAVEKTINYAGSAMGLTPDQIQQPDIRSYLENMAIGTALGGEMSRKRPSNAPEPAPRPNVPPTPPKAATEPPAQPEAPPVAGTESMARYQGPAVPESQNVAPEPPQPPPSTGTATASVPVMITKQMEADLRAAGFTDADINKMTPQEANDLLNPQPVGVTETIADLNKRYQPTPIGAEQANAISQHPAEPVGPQSGGNEGAGRPVEGQGVGPSNQFQEPAKTGQPPTEPVQAAAKTAPEGARTTGVANRVLTSEAEAGKIGEIKPGEGMSWQEMVDLGRQELNKGADPQQIARRLKSTGRISPTDFAVLRAERERLAVESNKAADFAASNPQDPLAQQALKVARQTETDWIRNTVQPAKTATSDVFRGMQGEAPIDATTFEGLRRAVVDRTGKEPTPVQATSMRRHMNRVRQASAAEAATAKKMGAAVERTFPKTKTPTLEELLGEMTKMAEELTPCK